MSIRRLPFYLETAILFADHYTKCSRAKEASDKGSQKQKRLIDVWQKGQKGPRRQDARIGPKRKISHVQIDSDDDLATSDREK